MRILLALTFLSCLVACTRSQVAIPTGWQKIDAKGHFTFHLPPDMKQSSLEGCEGCAWDGVYSDARIKLRAEYTPRDDEEHAQEYVQEYLDKQPEYAQELTEIDGRKAKIRSLRLKDSATGMSFFAEARYYEPDGKLLARMRATCKDRQDVEIAKQIFRTADFPG
jgi:hypothetical protein